MVRAGACAPGVLIPRMKTAGIPPRCSVRYYLVISEKRTLVNRFPARMFVFRVEYSYYLNFLYFLTLKAVFLAAWGFFFAPQVPWPVAEKL